MTIGRDRGSSARQGSAGPREHCPRSNPLSRAELDAVVLDLDGVITDTAQLHGRAWKATFDEYLAGVSQPPFRTSDYRDFVDGKPRYEGVRSFLASRGLSLPEGRPDDPPGSDTVCGLGNRKDQRFRQTLVSDGVAVFPPSMTFMRSARAAGFALAVASSSRNCRAVLEAAGISDFFHAIVDGLDLAHLGLQGKPEPDMFLEALKRLGVAPERAAGIEDAEVGVGALKVAGFGCVIGVAAGRRQELLRRQGADLAIGNLSELQVELES